MAFLSAKFVIGGLTLFLLYVECVLGQSGAIWENNLSDLLTVTGLKEDLEIGTTLGTLKVAIPFPVSFSTNSTYFAVDEKTGVVTLKQLLSYASNPSFYVAFYAVNPTYGFTTTTVVLVNVTAVNHFPFFDIPIYQVSVKENVPIGTTIYSYIYVTDIDTGPNGTVIISCTPDTDITCQTFGVTQEKVPDKVNSYLGYVVTRLSLDYRNISTYSMLITAQDNGTAPLTSTATLSITVESQYDNRPVFVNTPLIIVVNESSPSTTNLNSIQARPGNTQPPSQLTFRISGDTKNWFYLENATYDSPSGIYSSRIRTYGNISRAQLQSDQYSFNILAIQVLNGQVTQTSSETTVQIIIRSLNLFPPNFSPCCYTVNVTEGLGIGALLPGLNMFVQDLDQGDNAFFVINVTSVVPLPAQEIFLVQPTYAQGSTSVSLVANKPEYLSYSDPTKRQYFVQVTARETKTSQRLFGVANITVNVLSANVQPPVFTRPEYITSLVDNRAPGIVITDQVQASDPSGGAGGQITYSFTAGNEGSYFAIDPPTGKVSLARAVTYKQTGMYVVLTVQAMNTRGMTSTATLRIQIIDSSANGPQFNPNFIIANVPEGSTNITPPIYFVASPLERDRVVSYGIVGGNTNLFELITIRPPNNVGQPTGSIVMKYGVDYYNTTDDSGSFTITVQASDNGPTPLYTNLTIVVQVQDTNNHPPVFNPRTYYKEISEVTPGGTSLLTLNASDLDAPNTPNSRFHFIIADGGRDNFYVDYTTGIFSIASHPDLRVVERGNQYNVTVWAIDEGSPPLTGTAMIYIRVTDAVYRQPVFTDTSYTYLVIENTTVYTVIGAVNATSPDVRANIVYSVLPTSFTAINKTGGWVTAPSGVYDYRGSFTVNPTTGQILVNKKLSFDYAMRVDFQVLANVTNPTPGQTIDPVPVNVTVFIIQIPPSSDTVLFQNPSNKFAYISIYNTLTVPTQLFQLSAYYLATAKPIKNYTYVAQTPGTEGYISVDNTTGIITLVTYLKNLPLNLPINYTYFVTATSDPPKLVTETATFVLNIRDINADTPAFSQGPFNFTIYNNATVNQFVGQIIARLPGSASITGIVYALQGFNSDAFNIDSKTGTITVNKPDVVDGSYIFALTGLASYGNVPPTRVVVYIYVIHFYNNQKPSFIGQPYVFYTMDRIPINSVIGQINAIDPDPFHVSTIMYNVTDGNGTLYFGIDPVTGSIVTKRILVYSTNPYILTVSATSSGVPPQTNFDYNVKIYVANTSIDGVGFFVPSQDGQPFYAYVNSSNYPIVIVKGYSTRNNSKLIYNITSTPGYTGPPLFILDPNTGQLITNGSLKLNPNQLWQYVCMTVTDVINAMSAARCINVTFASSQPPSFDLCNGLNGTLGANVAELSPIGTNVTTITACSLDIPPNNTDIVYTITGGNDPKACYGGQSPFTIDQKTGLISTQVKLMWNCTSVVVLNVTVSKGDGTQAVNGSTRQVVIIINPTNSNGPSFDSGTNGTCKGIGSDVIEGILDYSKAGTDVVQMYAGDCDAPVYGGHNYSLNPSTIKFMNPNYPSQTALVPNAFVIDPITGDVTTNLKDYRMYSEGYFTMQIVAYDDQKRNATAMLTVFIVREGQRVKFVFARTPSQVRPVALNFLNDVNSFIATNNPDTSASGAVLGTHVDENAFYYFNMTDMCVQFIERSSTVYKVLSVQDAKDLFPTSNSQVVQLFNNYSVVDSPRACYVKTTTHWWSGYWFLWWLLIALALFIFVLALILNILACCFWPIYTRGYLKSRPYIVLDEPPTTTPVSDFEWQENMHRIN